MLLSTLILFLILLENSKTCVLLTTCPRPHSNYATGPRYHSACLRLSMTLGENCLEGTKHKSMIVFINSGHVAIKHHKFPRNALLSLSSTKSFYHSPQPLCSIGNLSRLREPMETADPGLLSCVSAFCSFAECWCQNPSRHVDRPSFSGEAKRRGAEDRRDSHGSMLWAATVNQPRLPGGGNTGPKEETAVSPINMILLT